MHEGCSIVLTTHYLEEAEALADRVAVMARGRLVAGGTRRRDPRARVAQEHPVPQHACPPETVRAWPEVLQVDR